MEEQRRARAEDRPALEAIWLSSFPEDTPADVAFFWNSGFRPEQAIVHTVDGRPVSMLFLLPSVLNIPDSTSLPVGYVYAAATLPDYRGRGLFSSLLKFAHKLAADAGMRACFLRPAQPSLETFYARLGYQPGFRAEIQTFSRQEIEDQAADAVPLVRRRPCPSPQRRTWLRERHIPYIDWDTVVWRFVVEGVQGEYWESPEWSALCAPNAQHLLVRELLCPLEQRPSFFRHLCDRYSFDHCTIRAPSADAGGAVFGMIHALDTQMENRLASVPPLYMGLALD